MVYEAIFWMVVITVLMNVIFGIIIDTFGKRETRTASLPPLPPPRGASFRVRGHPFDATGLAGEERTNNQIA